MTAGSHPALETQDLWFSYGARRDVLRGVTLRADFGRITMVLGRSGSGKTTLLRLIKGILAPRRGSVHVLGERVRAGPRERLDARVAYIPQQLGLVRSLSVQDNTLIGALGRMSLVASLAKVAPPPEVARARELLEKLGIGHKAEQPVHALSGGERQRVAIARALMQQPRVLLADEFISQLDPVTSVDMMEVVRTVAGSGVAVVQTTHEMEIVDRYADFVVVLREGEKAFEGPSMMAGQIAAALRA